MDQIAPHPTRSRRKMQTVTMSDVAREAGVSPSTVSLFLRRPEAVSAAAGQGIARAIERLNYVPNLMAGGLASAGSRAVSILVPSVRNAFFAETVATLQSELRRLGLQLILGHTEYDTREEEELVRMALSWAPAALVLTGLTHSAATRRMLAGVRVPVIEVWELGGPVIDRAIGFHHDQVGATMAQHLIAQGRRNLVFLGARMHQDRRARQRCDGFLAEASAQGVPSRVIEHAGAASAELGATLLSDVLRQDRGIDGIACSNDHIALGVLFACQREGVAVPDRVAVIGFGDLNFAAACNPSLTTVRPSGALIGLETARMIAVHLQGDQPGARIVDTRFTLRHRRSS